MYFKLGDIILNTINSLKEKLWHSCVMGNNFVSPNKYTHKNRNTIVIETIYR